MAPPDRNQRVHRRTGQARATCSGGRGRADVARFFTKRLAQALREHRFRAALVHPNGGLGAGFYRLGDDRVGAFFALQVLEAKDARIRVIDHFTTESSLGAFFAGGLARTL